VSSDLQRSSMLDAPFRGTSADFLQSASIVVLHSNAGRRVASLNPRLENGISCWSGDLESKSVEFNEYRASSRRGRNLPHVGSKTQNDNIEFIQYPHRSRIGCHLSSEF